MENVLRRGLLAIIVVGCAGLLIELYLQEHTEDFKQWIPLILLVAGGLQAGWLFTRRTPSRRLLQAFALTMVAFLMAGVLGAWFHYSGNVEFELERTPELSGWALVRSALGGAFPSLAPGAMIQLGLVGLLFTFRHPARNRARMTTYETSQSMEA
jgi:uncharacterized membrane protein YfcA